MTHVSDKNNFLYLTASLVDQFPIPLGQHLVQALIMLTLASGIVGLRETRLHVSTKLGLIAAVL
jgi:hypothetical protein